MTFILNKEVYRCLRLRRVLFFGFFSQVISLGREQFRSAKWELVVKKRTH